MSNLRDSNKPQTVVVRVHSLYRRITARTLMLWSLSASLILWALLLGWFMPAFSQADFDDGGFESAIEQIEGRSWANQEPNPYGSQQQAAPATGGGQANGGQGGFFSQMAGSPAVTSQPKRGLFGKSKQPASTAKGKGKKGFMGKIMPKKETPGPSMESIVNVGPRETAPSMDILFRLPLPILGRQGLMEPGFYLAKPVLGGEFGKQIGIYQRNQLMATVSLRPAGSANPNSPLSPIPVKNAPGPAPTISARVSEGQQNVVLTLKEGETLYESEPIPVVER